MNPSSALLLWLILLLGLLRFDPARQPRISMALWVPVIWMFIAGSRLPSQWLGGNITTAATAAEEGNSLDRTIYSSLIILSIIILVLRSFRWGEFFRRNLALTAFLCFALLSVLWSDFPFVAFKRWFRDLGDYVVILVVLSDRQPLDAIRTVLRRLSYLLIPLSILLIKYYPALGNHYSYWTGTVEYVGAATSKNTLGGICVISGLAFFWDTATRWQDRKDWRTRRVILVNIAFVAMTTWLLNLSNSATSHVCLLLGCLVITAAHSKFFQRRPHFLQAMLPAGYLLYLILSLGFGMSGDLAQAVGRDPTFTGRTVIWNAVLSMHTNPVLGTGYENFWLGDRLLKVWALTGPGINEAHNGYLDVYLNLGLIGLFIVVAFLIASYVTICRRLKRFPSLGSFGAATWIILLFASTTEAVLKNGLPWTVFLLGALVVQRAPILRGASRPGSSFEASPSRLREAMTL
jgi:exopolysaccharide production protein ExoQ